MFLDRSWPIRGGAADIYIYRVRLPLFWCTCMTLNVSVQYNDGFLPDIILLTLCDSIGELF